ncbi:MOB kinase activator-like 1A [Humulus lupulus]|uniref:MOB kinase activator-like 1A n=1 Tax=Humulus lupulus TaxID=3486 RepID=UPI002B405882|nr:MOB kinase activator-like 1A [Humulus lupulus]
MLDHVLLGFLPCKRYERGQEHVDFSTFAMKVWARGLPILRCTLNGRDGDLRTLWGLWEQLGFISLSLPLTLMHIETTLGNGNLKEVIRLSPGEDCNKWLAVNNKILFLFSRIGLKELFVCWFFQLSLFVVYTVAVDFFNQVNILYGTLTEFCTPTSCPVMNARPVYSYKWADGVTTKEPIKVSAPKYVEYLMDWIEVQLDDESIFPQRLG